MTVLAGVGSRLSGLLAQRAVHRYASITDPGWGVTNGPVNYWVQATDSRGSTSALTYPGAAYDVTYSCIQ